MDKIIYIESDEEVIGVVDRLKHTAPEHVALVLPAGSVLLSSVINLKLLRDEAKHLGKKVAIVSSDSAGRAIADQVGFVVYDSVSNAKEEIESGSFSGHSIHHAKKIEKHSDPEQEEEEPEFVRKGHHSYQEKESKAKNRKREEAFHDLFEHSGEEPDYPEESSYSRLADESISQIRSRVAKINLKKGNGRIITIGIGVFFVAFLVMAFIFPRATVSINVFTQEQDLTIPFSVSVSQKSLDLESNSVLPAESNTQEKEITSTFSATGKKNVGEKAKGVIVVYNRSGRQHSIPAGSPLVAANGKTFAPKVTIAVPGAFVSDFGELVPGKVSFDVEAIESGTASNIPAGRFTIPAISEIPTLVYGLSEEPMIGGSDREAMVVTDEDIKQAKDKTAIEAEQKIADEFGIKGDRIFVKGLSKVEIVSSEASKKADEEAENFTVTIKARFSYLTFKREDFDSLFAKMAPLQLSDQKSIIGDGYREASYDVKNFDFDKKQGELQAKVKILVGTKINEEYLASRLSSLSVKEARSELLEYSDVELAGVSFFPPILVQSIPVNERGVKIKVEYIRK